MSKLRMSASTAKMPPPKPAGKWSAPSPLAAAPSRSSYRDEEIDDGSSGVERKPFIERATYGPADVTDRARELIRDGTFSCPDGNFNALFGDPQPFVVKTFEILFSNGQVMRFMEQQRAVFDVSKRQEEYANMRKRLVIFYKRVMPVKLDSIDTILKEFHDNYDGLEKMIFEKYGTPIDSSGSSNADPRYRAWRDRLVRFYEKYDPPKANHTNDGLVEHIDKFYSGNFDAFMKEVSAKYGGVPEPGDLSDPRSRLMAFYREHNPAKLNDSKFINELLEFYAGRESLMFQNLESKYNVAAKMRAQQQKKIVKECILLPPVNDASNTDAPRPWFKTDVFGVTSATLKFSWHDQGWGNSKGRVVAKKAGSWVPMTREAAPHNRTSHEIAQTIGGGRTQDLHFEFGYIVGGGGGHKIVIENAMFVVERDANADVQKSADAAAAPAAAAPSPAGDSSSSSVYRPRLIAFYAKYAPEKVNDGSIDKALNVWRGKEEQMFEKLAVKYGAEPRDGAAAKKRGRKLTNLRERLTVYFATYAPQKIPHVDRILQLYVGREQELFKALEQKYGPEPEVNTSLLEDAGFADLADAFGFEGDAGDDNNADGDDYLTPKKNSAEPEDREEITRLVAEIENIYRSESVVELAELLSKYARDDKGKLWSWAVVKVGPFYSADAGTGTAAAAAGDASSSSPRERLTRIYRKYCPEKLQDSINLDKALGRYHGREEEMFSLLVQKYGPEPPAPPAAPAAASATDSYRDRIERLFRKYVPEKLDTVGPLVEKYRGKEDALLEALTRKYGPEPPATNTTTTTTDASGAAGSASDTKSRLVRFFETYHADCIPGIDTFMKQILIEEIEEEQMWATLVRRFGPDPTAPAKSTTDATGKKKKNGGAKILTPRERLVRFYTEYDPTKLATVDDTLARYKGQTNQLFALLTRKYGPEPRGPRVAADVEMGEGEGGSAAAAMRNAGSGAVVAASVIQPREDIMYLRPSPLYSPMFDARLRLTRVFKQFDRPRLDEIDDLLFEHEDALEDLVRDTEKFYRYNPVYSLEPPLAGFDPHPPVACHGEVELYNHPATNMVHAFVRGNNGTLLHASSAAVDQPFTSWRCLSTPDDVRVESRIAVTTSSGSRTNNNDARGRMDVFCAGNKRIYHMVIEDNKAGTWKRIPGSEEHDYAVNKLAVCSGRFAEGGGGLEVFARTPENVLAYNCFQDGKWDSSFKTLPGCALRGAPCAVSCQPGHIDVFCRGNGDRLWTISYRSSSWGSWQNHGGKILGSQPVAIATSATGVDVFARDAEEGNLVSLHFENGQATHGGRWHVVAIGDTYGDPSVSLRNGMLMIASRNENNQPQWLTMDPRVLASPPAEDSSEYGETCWVVVAENQERFVTHTTPTIAQSPGRVTVVAIGKGGVPSSNIFNEQTETWVGWRELNGGCGDMKKIVDVFNTFDVDGSGMLDRQEATCALMHFYPDESPSMIVERITAADVNADGLLSLEEFAEIARAFV